MRENIRLFFIFCILFFVIWQCNSEKVESEYPDSIVDIDIRDTEATDISGEGTLEIKILVRSSFGNKESPDDIFIMTSVDKLENIISDTNLLTYKAKWQTDKIISLSLKKGEGVLAFIDNNNDSVLSSGDYFGWLYPADIEDGRKYIININAFMPFEIYQDQGLNGNEIQVFERIKENLGTAEGLDMIITKVEDEYFIYSQRGVISFRRIISENGYEYPVKIISGKNPIENNDLNALPTYIEEIGAGENPKNTQYTGAGYLQNDERVSFVDAEKTSYPFAYERIAQLFDDPNSGDIVGLLKPYGDGLYEIGSHGHLDITQSRAPLIFSGAGVKSGIVFEYAVKAVDIAPTLIKAMGGSKIIGVNKFNRISNQNYLRRQDGDVIEDILNGDVAQYAIIIISDGLSHTELQRAFEDKDYNIPNLRYLMENGVYFKYGQVTNYFSVTIPSHTTIGTGLYAGHHGIVNNLYYLRDTGRLLTLIDLGVNPSRYLREEIETIFEAYHRNFGKYDPRSNKNGKFSASINEPCTRGANYATLESLIYNFASYKYEPLPVIEELKQVTSADNTAVNQMIYLFEKGELPLPDLVMINLTSTDGAGHIWGPHSDMIKRVLEQTDFRIGRIMELYRKANIFDKTLFVFTADHGMEIQDKNRSFEYKIEGTNVTVPILDSLDVKYIGGLPFIYFKTMAYKIDKPILPGDGKYSVYVFDEDREFPVRLAKVSLKQNSNLYVCTTDDKGECTLNVDNLNKGKINIKIEHSAYNYVEEDIVIE